MDTFDDKDLVLQRASADLLAELHHCIPRFLFRGPASTAETQRRDISYAATLHLIRLLEPFQGWPQLLDPYLANLVSPFGDAFLAVVLPKQDERHNQVRARDKKLPLSQAICKVLYTFSKIRGPNVICRFLSNEPKHVNHLIEAFELRSKWVTESLDGTLPRCHPLTWEEKYIILLWLSHLLLAPFDLSMIGSGATSTMLVGARVDMEPSSLLPDLPEIARRIVRLAIDHLSSASKERDAAVSMLVRLANRPDMQRLGLHHALVRWSITRLQGRTGSGVASYESIGLLSFLARLIKSADVANIATDILYIFSSVTKLNALQPEKSSALARKAVIKVYRAASVASIRLERNKDYQGIDISRYVLEEVIDNLLTALADNDTPVRQASSKALSLITLELHSAMASEISEVIINGLDENLLWDNFPKLLSDGSHDAGAGTVKQPNMAAVNPLKWQGLVLTLSHLLFRRSLPMSQLPAILKCLILALSFEQRSSLGAPVGSNVRDAACFGIWALARRYSTEELSGVEATEVLNSRTRDGKTSILQILAVELVVTAVADPSGNIRRGASAALQEVIGRHPNTVAEGISLVQVVDYRAVAMRSRSLLEVSVKAARLGPIYWRAILKGLMTWRGIGATDIESRRLAAEAVGLLSKFGGAARFSEATGELWQSLFAPDGSNVAKRQGFMLAMASLVQALRHSDHKSKSDIDVMQRQWHIFSETFFFSDKDFTSIRLRPDLTAEGACRLIDELARASSGVTAVLKPADPLVLTACLRLLDLSLDRKEIIVQEHAALAIKALLTLLANETQSSWLHETLSKCRTQCEANVFGCLGRLYALGHVHSSMTKGLRGRDDILEAIMFTMEHAKDIDARIAATKSLASLISADDKLNSRMAPTIQTALQDYTTDQRGDIGSVLRLEALRTVESTYPNESFSVLEGHELILGAISTLAGEKLDKVRHQAWRCLRRFWEIDDEPGRALFAEHSSFPTSRASRTAGQGTGHPELDQITPRNYFSLFLSLFYFKPLIVHLWNGLVTSISGGSESVLVASRSALRDYVEALAPTRLLLFAQYFEDFLRSSLGIERLVVPALETLAFLLDMNIFSEAMDKSFKWRTLLVLVQRAHFKTTNVAKLHAALEVYAGLGQMESAKNEVIQKLGGLLLHPFPNIRSCSAEVLFTLTQNESLVFVDWTKPTKETKTLVRMIRQSTL